MPAVRSGSLRGTRAPEGSAPARQYPEATYPEVPLWPGITWGRDARCSCSWSVRYGVMQVKVRSGACLVHVPGRVPEPERREVPLPELLGELIALIAVTAGAARRTAARSRNAAGAAHCPCGREYDLTDSEGKRRCSECRRRQGREGMARHRARKRAGAKAGQMGKAA